MGVKAVEVRVMAVLDCVDGGCGGGGGDVVAVVVMWCRWG